MRRPALIFDFGNVVAHFDYRKAASLGLSADSINSELSSILGSSYVNDFIDKGRVKKVYMQADAPFRMQPEDIFRWHRRTRKPLWN